MSLARQHQQRILAGLAAGGAMPGTAGKPPTEGPAATAYEQMLIGLLEDRRRLHDIQSIKRKIELKRTLVPNYDAWVQGAITAARETGRAVQDEIVVTMMVWNIDIGDFEEALSIGGHVIKYRLALPERYKRDTATLLTEEISEAALAHLARGESFDVSILFALDDLVESHDMPDEVRAKLQKAIGLQLAHGADAEDPDQPARIAGFAAASRTEALARLRTALKLNDKCGVKKNIERLERALRKDTAQGPSAVPASEAANVVPIIGGQPVA